MSEKLIIETFYLPNTYILSLCKRYPKVYIEAWEHYQKGGFRNRCYIANANGVQVLSIPLRKGKHEGLSIREVAIAYEESWQKKHWKAIESAYRNAPYFDHYAPHFEAIYSQKFTYLFDFNLALWECLINNIGLKLKLNLSADYQKDYPPNEVHDHRNLWKPNKNLRVGESMPNLGSYPQVFTEKHGFLSNLSSLDLLFCMGPEAFYFL